jgi:hypothetical protein
MIHWQSQLISVYVVAMQDLTIVEVKLGNYNGF